MNSRMVKGLIFLIVAILLSTTIFATTVSSIKYSATVVPVRDKILLDGYAIFEITIQNNQDTQDQFKLLKVGDVKWTPQYVPSNYVVTVPAKSSKTIKVYLKPSNIQEGTHNFKGMIESLNLETRADLLYRVYVGPHPSMYKENLTVSILTPTKINPTSDQVFNIKLKNNNIIDLGNVNVSVSGGLLNEQQTVYLGPKAETIVSIAFNFKDQLKPQTDNLVVYVNNKNKVFYNDLKQIEIVEYVPTFVQNESVKKTFLKSERTIYLKNNGNIEKEAPIRIGTAKRTVVFSSTNPKAELINEQGDSYYLWNTNLAPGEETTIIITTSYRGLLALIILLCLAYITYLVLRPAVQISKKYENLVYDEGLISEAKIFLHIKNNTKKQIKHLEIIDRIPHVLGVKTGSFKLTLEPKKSYMHKQEGSVIEYEIPHLEPLEERIITYSVKARLKVFGSVLLKPAITKHKEDGKIQKSFSKSIELPAMNGVSEPMEE